MDSTKLSALLAECLQSPKPAVRRVVSRYLLSVDAVPADLAGDEGYLQDRPVAELSLVYFLATGVRT